MRHCQPQPESRSLHYRSTCVADAAVAARQAIHFVTWEKLHGMRCQTRLAEKGKERSSCPGPIPQANVYVCAICDFVFCNDLHDMPQDADTLTGQGQVTGSRVGSSQILFAITALFQGLCNHCAQ